MAKKKTTSNKQADRPASGPDPSGNGGIGALILGGLVWLVGPLTKENAVEWLKSLLIAGALALMIRWPLGEPFKIPSASMEPTLYAGDRIFVNKFVYGVKFPFNGYRIPFTTKKLWYADRRIWQGAKPERWDIVVFYSIESDVKHDILVKRIVGLPGERVHIANGKVYINGAALEPPAAMPDVEYTSDQPGMEFGVLEDETHSAIPEGHYLMLGDNSAHSRDGRYWGWVPNHHILGRVSNIWWPVERWRDFTGFSETLWWRGLLVFLGFLVFARLFLGRLWRAHNDALKDMLRQGDHIYISRRPFGIPVPFTAWKLSQGRFARRGEVVLYRAPADDGAAPGVLLGRVVGLPGERVYLDAGNLQVNDKPVTEPPSLADRAFPSSGDVGPYGRSRGRQYSMIPDGHYYILVDDPSETPDSRSLGWIPHKDVVGRASVVWWPPTRWRRIRP